MKKHRLYRWLAYFSLFGPLSSQSDSLSSQLEKAYEKQSEKQLQQFFATWRARFPAFEREKIQKESRLIQEGYAAYEAFFNPFDLAQIGKSERGRYLYKDVKYVILQNTLEVRSMTTLDFSEFQEEENEKKITKQSAIISDFRPALNQGTAIQVYLTTEYKNAIEKFLGALQTKATTPNVMNPSRAKGESIARMAFLNKLAKIEHGHWQGWLLETHPYVFKIYFDGDFQRARIPFQLIYQGGEAILEKSNGKWKVTKSEITWVE